MDSIKLPTVEESQEVARQEILTALRIRIGENYTVTVKGIPGTRTLQLAEVVFALGDPWLIWTHPHGRREVTRTPLDALTTVVTP
jgi:hypothetical protein